MVKSGNKFTFTTIDPNFDGLGVGKCSKPGLHSFLLICHIQYIIYCIKSTVKSTNIQHVAVFCSRFGLWLPRTLERRYIWTTECGLLPLILRLGKNLMLRWLMFDSNKNPAVTFCENLIFAFWTSSSFLNCWCLNLLCFQFGVCLCIAMRTYWHFSAKRVFILVMYIYGTIWQTW